MDVENRWEAYRVIPMDGEINGPDQFVESASLGAQLPGLSLANR